MFKFEVASTHYLNRYVKFIESCKVQAINGLYEKHHIVPRSLGGTDAAENLVKLTPRQHFVAHLILSKIFAGESKKKNDICCLEYG